MKHGTSNQRRDSNTFCKSCAARDAPRLLGKNGLPAKLGGKSPFKWRHSSGDHFWDCLHPVVVEYEKLHQALQLIHDLTNDEIRTGVTEDDSLIWTIEAEARAALRLLNETSTDTP